MQVAHGTPVLAKEKDAYGVLATVLGEPLLSVQKAETENTDDLWV
jgi:hypothetical protein